MGKVEPWTRLFCIVLMLKFVKRNGKLFSRFYKKIKKVLPFQDYICF